MHDICVLILVPGTKYTDLNFSRMATRNGPHAILCTFICQCFRYLLFFDSIRSLNQSFFYKYFVIRVRSYNHFFQIHVMFEYNFSISLLLVFLLFCLFMFYVYTLNFVYSYAEHILNFLEMYV